MRGVPSNPVPTLLAWGEDVKCLGGKVHKTNKIIDLCGWLGFVGVGPVGIMPREVLANPVAAGAGQGESFKWPPWADMMKAHCLSDTGE